MGDRQWQTACTRRSWRCGYLACPILKNTGLTLAAILVTHHHADHTGGIKTLVNASDAPVTVYGPKGGKYQPIDVALRHEDNVEIKGLDINFNIKAVPGHTLDHIVYHNPELAVLFCGDTLFSGGCGRVFEGSYTQMFCALKLLSTLPDDTLVYCTHEYTLANLHFALAVEPNNLDLIQYFNHVTHQREQDKITLPTTIAQEKQINPFMRWQHNDVIESAATYSGKTKLSDEEVFSTIRQWKDNF